jgi:transcriptional regulator with XRE-family HTH domain
MDTVLRSGFEPAVVGREELGSEGPHPVDRHVGLRIRMRRKELGISQEKLAEALGLTFQQVQKYERAANRVSASKLFEIARALNTGVAYFYEGLAPGDELGSPASASLDAKAFMLTPEGAELAATFHRIGRSRVRRKLVELVRVLVDSDAADDAAEAIRRRPFSYEA